MRFRPFKRCEQFVLSADDGSWQTKKLELIPHILVDLVTTGGESILITPKMTAEGKKTGAYYITPVTLVSEEPIG